MRASIVAFWLGVSFTSLGAQVVIDSTLQRVYGVPIMATDVRQARLLGVLKPVPASDPEVLTALENRLLILHESARAEIGEPTAEQIADRRRDWLASRPAGTDEALLLQRAGLTAKSLDGWFRDDIRIEAYLEQRFGPAAEPRRAARIADWVRDLRARANLIGKPPGA